MGFVELTAMDAETISNAIDQFIQSSGLDTINCVGQGYDSCSTMAGKDGGVQKKMRKTNPKALFFYCASHRLNLVVNDLNAFPEVRNTIATVKEETAFCETRSSQKYKSMSIFKINFEMLVNVLDTFSKEGNVAMRPRVPFSYFRQQ